LWRAPEVIGGVTLAWLAWGVWRGRLRLRDNATLFTVSLALLPFAVLNQQVVTGRLLQPFHYQWYIANYGVVLAAVLAAWLLWRRQPDGLRPWHDQRLLACALAALTWGAGEVWLASSVSLRYNRRMDEAYKVMQLLAAEPEARSLTRPATANPRPLALVADFTLTDRVPANAPQAMLWTPHLLVFPGTAVAEARERFWLQLYLSGYDEAKFLQTLDTREWCFYAGMFDYDKLSPVLSGQGLSREDIRAKQQEYAAFVAALSSEQVARYPLSYFVVRHDKLPDFTNLDRWYERDAGAQSGVYTLYRLKLRAEFSAAQ
jgi:hypothetical protein